MRAAMDCAVLTPAEMQQADRLAAAHGEASSRLMERAGAAVAEAIGARWAPRPVAILCGPGNNGGDGFVAARHLAAAGWPVRVYLLGSRETLQGDAAHHAGLWHGAVAPVTEDLPDDLGLVVDCLFGAGLSRPLAGVARTLLERLVSRKLPIVAVDVPSGLDGATGQIRGFAPTAMLTVTFFRKKPGHLLFPGRALCGEIVVADIGIPAAVLEIINPCCFENDPALWLTHFPWPNATSHKYHRGHALIAGGAVMTGAARLAARAAARAGAGLVTLAAPSEAFAIYAAALASIIVRPFDGLEGFVGLLEDSRRNAILLGPGLGEGETALGLVLAALGTGRSVVLDADVFSLFAGRRSELQGAIVGPTLLTPHEGEFGRVFTPAEDKLSRARNAARESGATIVLKGADTVIAAPDHLVPGGWTAINGNAPPDLATAGSGDVLAGLATGLLAQGMPIHLAAAAAVWLHGAAAARFGPGLVAEDLIETMPAVLRLLKQRIGC